jgi:hypothetical protein
VADIRLNRLSIELVDDRFRAQLTIVIRSYHLYLLKVKSLYCAIILFVFSLNSVLLAHKNWRCRPLLVGCWYTLQSPKSHIDLLNRRWSRRVDVWRGRRTTVLWIIVFCLAFFLWVSG